MITFLYSVVGTSCMLLYYDWVIPGSAVDKFEGEKRTDDTYSEAELFVQGKLITKAVLTSQHCDKNLLSFLFDYERN